MYKLLIDIGASASSVGITIEQRYDGLTMPALFIQARKMKQKKTVNCSSLHLQVASCFTCTATSKRRVKPSLRLACNYRTSLEQQRAGRGWAVWPFLLVCSTLEPMPCSSLAVLGSSTVVPV